MISQKQKWIFIHIQKTGGTAIRAALDVELHDSRKHFFAHELRSLYGHTDWDSHFKFAIVRNPWDRLVSWWSMIDAARDHAGQLNKFQSYVLKQARTFDEFIANCTDEIVDEDGRKNIFRNQIDYLADENGNVIVDYVGRFETLQNSFDMITERIGTGPIQLPHINASSHKHYTEYYTPDTAATVGRIYARDIERFGYRFGG